MANKYNLIRVKQPLIIQEEEQDLNIDIPNIIFKKLYDTKYTSHKEYHKRVKGKDFKTFLKYARKQKNFLKDINTKWR